MIPNRIHFQPCLVVPDALEAELCYSSHGFAPGDAVVGAGAALPGGNVPLPALKLLVGGGH